MVNEEIGNASSELTCRIASIDNKIRDTESRLGKLFDALETGKYDNDDFAPRLKELRTRQTELGKARILAEAEIALQGETDLDRAKIKSYVLDMKGLLEGSEVVERKSFLMTFIKKIVIDGSQVVIHYNLPIPPEVISEGRKPVLPIVTSGGAGGIRTLYLLTASQTLSQLSYSPMTQI